MLRKGQAANRDQIEMLKAQSVEMEREMKQQSERVATWSERVATIMNTADREYQEREKTKPVHAREKAQSEQSGQDDMSTKDDLNTGKPADSGDLDY